MSFIEDIFIYLENSKSFWLDWWCESYEKPCLVGNFGVSLKNHIYMVRFKTQPSQVSQKIGL